MSKNRGKSKLSKTVLFNANKHVFHCEKSLGPLFYGPPSYSELLLGNNREISDYTPATPWQQLPAADVLFPLGSQTVPGLSYQLLTAAVHN
jgi:hypothetical protein